MRMRFGFSAALLIAAACAPATTTPRAESDDRPRSVRSVVVDDARTLLVDTRDRLVLHDAIAQLRRPLLDNVIGTPALLPDRQRAIVARTTDIGQSDLWIVRLDGSVPPRALAAAHGADTQPRIDSVGRVRFISDRSGVASEWSVDLDGQNLRQLTNVGERAGKLSHRFVQPPVDLSAGVRR